MEALSWTAKFTKSLRWSTFKLHLSIMTLLPDFKALCAAATHCFRLPGVPLLLMVSWLMRTKGVLLDWARAWLKVLLPLPLRPMRMSITGVTGPAPLPAAYGDSRGPTTRAASTPAATVPCSRDPARSLSAILPLPSRPSTAAAASALPAPLVPSTPRLMLAAVPPFTLAVAAAAAAVAAPPPPPLAPSGEKAPAGLMVGLLLARCLLLCGSRPSSSHSCFPCVICVGPNCMWICGGCALCC